MLAELIRLTECTPEDPCFVAKLWHGVEKGAAEGPLGDCWKVVLRSSGKAVGNGGLLVLDELDGVAELYYRLEIGQGSPEVHVAAVRALVDLGCQRLELIKIHAWCLDDDKMFHQVYRQVGMKLVEVLPKSRCLQGHWHDSYLYSIASREWEHTASDTVS